MLGASFASVAGAGNEPPFCASFAAGLTLRILAYETLPAAVTGFFAGRLRNAKIEFVGLDEVAARASSGVGSCGGGPLRAALGWLDMPLLPPLAARAIKGALLLLPCLAAAQWALRAVKGYGRWRREMAREGRPRHSRFNGEPMLAVLRRRAAVSAVMASVMGVLITFFATCAAARRPRADPCGPCAWRGGRRAGTSSTPSTRRSATCSRSRCSAASSRRGSLRASEGGRARGGGTERSTPARQALLATYEVRGRLRQFVFFVTFMVL